MGDDDRTAMTPQTSGSAARGTEGGGGEPPEHLPDHDEDAAGGGDRMRRAQEAMQSSDIEHPLEGEGTTEEGRRQAIATAAGPQTEAAPDDTTAREPGRDEPHPDAVRGD